MVSFYVAKLLTFAYHAWVPSKLVGYLCLSLCMCVCPPQFKGLFRCFVLLVLNMHHFHSKVLKPHP